MTVVANIVNYTIRYPEKGAPFVIIRFSYLDDFSGKQKEISWLGSLSDKARKYTIERLKSIGLVGDLTSYDEVMAVIDGNAGWVTDNITIKIEERTYNGKKQNNVVSFYMPKELTADEKIDLTKKVLNYTSRPQQPAQAKPKQKLPVKKQNVEVAQQLTLQQMQHTQSKFNADEEKPDFSEPPKSTTGKPAPF